MSSLSLSLVCVSRINIEIGRSFIHRSFPRRVECPYLSEREYQARDETRKTLRLGSRFPPPLSPPSSPSHPSSFSLCLPVLVTYLRLTFVVGASRGISAPLSRPSFCSLYTNPLFVLPLACSCLLSSFLAFRRRRRRRSILSGRSSLDHWPGRKLEHVSTL